MPFLPEEAGSLIEFASGILFDADSRITTVGIGQQDGRPVIRAVRNVAAVVPQSTTPKLPSTVENLPVQIVDAESNVFPLIKLPVSGAGSPAGLLREQRNHNPLCCGLQIQNFDFDLRNGHTANNITTIGTLGCFVKLNDDRTALISNNHVIAGENDGLTGQDRILQPGAVKIGSGDEVAILEDFVALRDSPPGARYPDPNIRFNQVDAALAVLLTDKPHLQAFLQERNCPPPSGTTTATLDERVIKVGRTTAKTMGKITNIGVTIGPVLYDSGEAWFNGCFEITSDPSGGLFSDGGDSGSVIMTEKGDIVGLLFAGNGTHTYACPIVDVLELLNCVLDLR